MRQDKTRQNKTNRIQRKSKPKLRRQDKNKREQTSKTRQREAQQHFYFGRIFKVKSLLRYWPLLTYISLVSFFIGIRNTLFILFFWSFLLPLADLVFSSRLVLSLILPLSRLVFVLPLPLGSSTRQRTPWFGLLLLR
jgi:hypothetical protein